MKAELSCAEVSERLAAYHERWLSEDEAQMVAHHLRSCEACAQEAMLDARVAQELRLLPTPPTPAVRWEAPVRESSWSGWRLALPAAALATVLGLLLIPGLPRSTPEPVAKVPPAVDTPNDEALAKAHLAMTSLDLGADPNRAIMLRLARDAGGTTP